MRILREKKSIELMWSEYRDYDYLPYGRLREKHDFKCLNVS